MVVDALAVAAVGTSVTTVALALLSSRRRGASAVGGRRSATSVQREAVFTDFVESYSHARRLLLSAPSVRLCDDPRSGRFGTPLVNGSSAVWDVVAAANLRVRQVAPGTDVDRAAFAAMQDLIDVARARQAAGGGPVPEPYLDAYRAVVRAFVDAACENVDLRMWSERLES